MSVNSEKKDELISVIRLAQAESCRILKESQKGVENAQYAKEMANAAECFVEAIPEDKYLVPEEWNKHIKNWGDYASDLSNFSYKAPMLLCSSDSTATTFINLVFHDEIIQKFPNPAREQALQGAQHFKAVIENRQLQDEVVWEMKRLGLDQTIPDNRPATDLLGEAYFSLKRPSSDEPAPIAVLISIREAIDRTLADLLRKRPTQEKTKRNSDKIESILKQCGKDGLQSFVIAQLANGVVYLHQNLSIGKGRNYKHNEISNLLTQSALFLKSFLECIDANKLRK